MRKDDLNMHVFQNRNWVAFYRKEFKLESNMEVRGQFLEKRNLCIQNLTKEWKQPLVGILQQANFCDIFALYLWLKIIKRFDQGV